MLRNYLKIALRTLWKNKVYSFINIGGLAVGLVGCLAIGLYVWDEYQHDRAVPQFENVYRLTERQKQADGIYEVAVTPGPLAPVIQRDFAEVHQTVRVGQWFGQIQHQQKSLEAKKMRFVDASFFQFFGFKLLAGNPKTIFSAPDEVVLSEEAVAHFFGQDWQKKQVIGQVFQFTPQLNLRLTGVVQNTPTRSHIQYDVLLPFKYVEKYDEWNYKWSNNSYHTYLKLRPDTDVAAFGRKIVGLLEKYDNGNKTPLLLQPLGEIHLQSKFDFGTDWETHGDAAYVRIFVAVGLVVLLIALFNFINLSTARATQRAREVGVRKSAGALRSSLVVQFWGESLLMTTLALGFGLLLVQSLMPFFNELSGKILVVPFEEPLFWVSMFALLVVVSFLAGLYPAFYLSSFRPAKVLKGVFDKQAGSGFRKTLVVVQFTLSVVLMIGTVGLYRQLEFMQNRNLGFNKQQLLYVRMKGDLRAKSAVFKEELTKKTSIAAVSASTSALIDVQNSSYVEWEGQAAKDKEQVLITQMNVDADFVKTTGMRLAAGRNFSAAIASDTSDKQGTYLLNETAARRMGWTAAQALGKKVKFWGLEGVVVGVLKDFHFRPLSVAIEPFILRFRPKEFYFNLLVKTNAAQTQRAIADISQIYKKLEPKSPISYGFVDEDLAQQYAIEQRTGELLLTFSVLAILIACLGLFGLAAFTAEQRTKEIGIRKVLGASVVSITTLLSKDFLKLVLVAVVIASPVAYYAMNRWLQDFAYRIEISWWIFALAGILAVGIALLTVGYQAIRAALMNPVESLKTE